MGQFCEDPNHAKNHAVLCLLRCYKRAAAAQRLVFIYLLLAWFDACGSLKSSVVVVSKKNSAINLLLCSKLFSKITSRPSRQYF